MDISKIREDYSKSYLLEENIIENPFGQFKKWLDDALNSEILEPTAMHLATISAELRPNGRIVLLKHFDENGFCFFTNFNSQKGNDIVLNSFGSITFFWPDLERQIRIGGKIEKMDVVDSEKYFKERPRNSQIGAWASPQSQIIESREILEQNYIDFEKKFENVTIPKPDNWGGYCLKPDRFEFWQGRQSRLHDRITFNLNENKTWDINRLAP